MGTRYYNTEIGAFTVVVDDDAYAEAYSIGDAVSDLAYQNHQVTELGQRTINLFNNYDVLTNFVSLDMPYSDWLTEVLNIFAPNRLVTFVDAPEDIYYTYPYDVNGQSIYRIQQERQVTSASNNTFLKINEYFSINDTYWLGTNIGYITSGTIHEHPLNEYFSFGGIFAKSDLSEIGTLSLNGNSLQGANPWIHVGFSPYQSTNLTNMQTWIHNAPYYTTRYESIAQGWAIAPLSPLETALDNSTFTNTHLHRRTTDEFQVSIDISGEDITYLIPGIFKIESITTVEDYAPDSSSTVLSNSDYVIDIVSRTITFTEPRIAGHKIYISGTQTTTETSFLIAGTHSYRYINNTPSDEELAQHEIP